MNKIIEGDALNILKQLDDESIDLLCSDPPYALTSEEYKHDKKYKGGFMNKEWDSQIVSVDIWKECLRVLKSGAFAFIMCTPRQDVLARQIINLQDAGFRTNFTSIYWTYASGFPKAANVSKLVDKRLGVERNIISGTSKPHEYSGKFDQRSSKDRPKDLGSVSNEVKKLDGSYAGFQPKPALETILVVMKPLSEKSFVDQSLNNGKGITWLDNCRIPFQNNTDYNSAKFGTQTDIKNNNYGTNRPSNGHIYNKDVEANPKGRFPANLIVSDVSLNDGKIRKTGDLFNGSLSPNKTIPNYNSYIKNKIDNPKNHVGDSGSYSRYFDLDKWYEAQFIITPKASASERNKGCEGLPKIETPTLGRYQNRIENGKITNPKSPVPKLGNHHPTVKPLKLMSYLITMGSRENDLILDPFCGSGTTCIAALQLNRRFIGIEKNKDYVEIANKRLEPYIKQIRLTDY